MVNQKARLSIEMSLANPKSASLNEASSSRFTRRMFPANQERILWEEIIWRIYLDIAMDNLGVVAICSDFEKTLYDVARFSFGITSFFHDAIEKLTTFNEFRHEDEEFGLCIKLIESNCIGVLHPNSYSSFAWPASKRSEVAMIVAVAASLTLDLVFLLSQMSEFLVGCYYWLLSFSFHPIEH